MRLDQIKKLVVTEKSVRLFENQQYVFDVDPSLNKTEIRNFFIENNDKNFQLCSYLEDLKQER